MPNRPRSNAAGATPWMNKSISPISKAGRFKAKVQVDGGQLFQLLAQSRASQLEFSVSLLSASTNALACIFVKWDRLMVGTMRRPSFLAGLRGQWPATI